MCSIEVGLAVSEVTPTLRLTLDATVSGAYAIVAFDPRRASAPARVLQIGWHDAARPTSIELGLSPSPDAALALRAWLVPASGVRCAALASAPVALGRTNGTLDPSLTSGSSAALLATAMRVQRCGLDCQSSSLPNAPITCGVTSTYANADLRFRFTLPIDPSSISTATFQIFDVATGMTPPGTYGIDAHDQHTLLFRPALTFDALGNPHFGFQNGASYLLRLPGVAQFDAPPYVMSTTALPNQDRVLCTITTQGVLDYVPGAPHATLKVDVVASRDPVTGAPTAIAFDVPAANATNVWVDSKLTFEFDDVMNVSTLVIPASGVMPFISVKIDVDGNLNTLGDQYAQPGSASVSVDQIAHTTRLVFHPQPSWPHSGSGPSPMLVVVDVPSTVHDIVGNGVANAGAISFRAEP